MQSFRSDKSTDPTIRRILVIILDALIAVLVLLALTDHSIRPDGGLP